jgi:ankyrin repeat protein
MAKLLPGADSIDVNSKDNYGSTALSWAAEKGHETIVKLLLSTDGIDVNSNEDEYS